MKTKTNTRVSSALKFDKSVIEAILDDREDGINKFILPYIEKLIKAVIKNQEDSLPNHEFFSITVEFRTGEE